MHHATRLKAEQYAWIAEQGYAYYDNSSGHDIARLLQKGRERFTPHIIDPLPGNDHGRCYKYKGRGGAIEVLIQPYRTDDGFKQELTAWCERNGAAWEQLPVSWYYPEHTGAYLIKAKRAV